MRSMPFFALFILLGVFLTACMQNTEKPLENIRDFKLAMVQMEVIGGDLDANLQTASERIKEAAAHGARIAVLPEAMDFGWCHSSAREQAGAIPGGTSFEELSRAARENRIFVCAGIIERDGDKLYNAAVIISPEGKLLLKHRKLNELTLAHDLYDQGDRLGVVHTELGTLGLLICADANAKDYTISKSLCYMGADIILSPSAWAVPVDHDNSIKPYGWLWRRSYSEITSKFRVWFIGVSNVGKMEEGEWKGRSCIGCSLAFNDDGNEVVQGPYGASADTILYIDINRHNRPARGTGWNHYLEQRGRVPTD